LFLKTNYISKKCENIGPFGICEVNVMSKCRISFFICLVWWDWLYKYSYSVQYVNYTAIYLLLFKLSKKFLVGRLVYCLQRWAYRNWIL